VKLSGNPEAPIERRGHTLSPRARGDSTCDHGRLHSPRHFHGTPEPDSGISRGGIPAPARHGPLQTRV